MILLMKPPILLNTPRLLLRPWKEADLALFAEMNRDPRVREFFPSLLKQEESDRMAHAYMSHIEIYGWGLWAVELKANGHFIGFIGLQHVDFVAPFTPAVEIGWRLAHPYWGNGYATEGALEALNCAFLQIKLPQVVSFAVYNNQRSQQVMKKIGMHHRPEEDFEHPLLPQGHPMRKHVLYRVSRDDWEKNNRRGNQ